MEQLLICLSVALIAGLLMSRLAKAIHLPAVTSYLLAGLLLGPFFLGRLGLSNFGIGFGTLEQVDSLSIITQVARAGDVLFDPLVEHFKTYAFKSCRETPIKAASLGNDAGIYGAVRLIVGD